MSIGEVMVELSSTAREVGPEARVEAEQASSEDGITTRAAGGSEQVDTKLYPSSISKQWLHILLCRHFTV